MNPNSSEVCLYLARALSTAGKASKKRSRTTSSAAELDPGNPTITGDWASDLKMARSAEEALRVSREFEARYPGLTTYGWRLFGFTGQLERARSEAARLEAAGDPGGANGRAIRAAAVFTAPRRARTVGREIRFHDMPQASFGGFTIPAIGRKPVAELHGWARLLEKDAAAAARDGRAHPGIRGARTGDQVERLVFAHAGGGRGVVHR